MAFLSLSLFPHSNDLWTACQVQRLFERHHVVQKNHFLPTFSTNNSLPVSVLLVNSAQAGKKVCLLDACFGRLL